MVKNIHKYMLHETVNEFVLPKGSKVISAGCQRDELVIWVFAPKLSERTHRFQVSAIGTGWALDFDEVGEFVQTVQMPDGLVWHIFARDKDA